ncbi:MAG: matrixin family metalloprotease [Thaumarchaeota archaeon]|nr:matrixin family metalloprotease [Nitrososphaerota archaeon]
MQTIVWVPVLFTVLFCTFISINDARAQDSYAVPSWTKEISDFWTQGRLSDTEFVNAFQYLTDNKIVTVPSLKFESVSFDKKLEYTKTLSSFLWSENAEPVSPDKTDSQSVTHYIYVQPIPDTTQFTSDLVLKSTNYWSERTGSKFSIVSDPMDATINVTWLTEPHSEYIGYTIGKTAEVSIGDSKCDGTWHAYNMDFISSTLSHELGHALGFGHSTNKDDIMYPVIPNAKYAPIIQTLTLEPDQPVFVHTCTFGQKGTFHYIINSDDQKDPIKIFFVPSKMEFNKFREGQVFNHYTNEGCFGTQSSSYYSACANVSRDGGLLISSSSHDTQRITVTLEEE